MTREVHTSRAIKGTKGAGSSPATTGIAKEGAHKLKARSQELAMRLEIVQGTGNAKSASQQEEWDWLSWKKSKNGKRRRKSKKDSSSFGTESSSSSSESSPGKKGRKKERKKQKEKEAKEIQEIRKTQPVKIQVTSR